MSDSKTVIITDIPIISKRIVWFCLGIWSLFVKAKNKKQPKRPNIAPLDPVCVYVSGRNTKVAALPAIPEIR
nr:hypothetical protein [Heyndrickxia camelliae]